MSQLTLERITAGYRGSAPVLQGIDLTLAAGEVVSVLGPSGSGKTTLARVIAGLHRPDSGRVLIGGDDVTSTPPERRGVGLVPQDGALFGHLSVAANVGYGVRGLTGRRAPTDPRVTRLLELVGLPGLGRRLPHQLSGGQQQRVALARALAIEPRLVLLDEPFNALDARLREQVRADVVATLRTTGVTTVLITHDQQEAMGLSDRVAVLRDGVLAQVDAPERLYRRPVDAWVARFLGEAVLLTGRRRGGTLIDTPLGGVSTDGAQPAHERPQVLLRPEQLELTGSGEGGVPGTVTAVEFLGPATLVRLLVPDGDGGRVPVAARASSGSGLATGAVVGVRATGVGHELPPDQG